MNARKSTVRRLARQMKKGEIYALPCIGPEKRPIPSVLDRVIGRYLVRTELGGLIGPTDSESVPDMIARGRAAFPDAWVVRVDIRQFFRSIPTGIGPSLVHGVVSPFAQSWIEATVVVDAPLYPGVPAGRPDSHRLADLYLAPFDAWVRSQPVLYRRYVDDLLFILPWARTEADAFGFLDLVREALPRGLTISDKPEKLAVVPIRGTFTYLGIEYRDGQPFLPPDKPERLKTSLREIHEGAKRKDPQKVLAGWLRYHEVCANDPKLWLLLSEIERDWPHLIETILPFRARLLRGARPTVLVQSPGLVSHQGFSPCRLGASSGTCTPNYRSVPSGPRMPSAQGADQLPASAAAEEFDAFDLLARPERTRPLREGELIESMGRSTASFLAWADVLDDPGLRGVWRALGFVSARAFALEHLRVHSGLLRRVQILRRRMVSICARIAHAECLDPDDVEIRVPVQLLMEAVEMHSERRWAWRQREELIELAAQGRVTAENAVRSLRASRERAREARRGSGQRVRWSVVLTDGFTLDQDGHLSSWRTRC